MCLKKGERKSNLVCTFDFSGDVPYIEKFMMIFMWLGNGGGDQVQIGPSPFTSVMGQPSIGFVNGKLNQKCIV